MMRLPSGPILTWGTGMASSSSSSSGSSTWISSLLACNSGFTVGSMSLLTLWMDFSGFFWSLQWHFFPSSYISFLCYIKSIIFLVFFFQITYICIMSGYYLQTYGMKFLLGFQNMRSDIFMEVLSRGASFEMSTFVCLLTCKVITNLYNTACIQTSSQYKIQKANVYN